MKGPRPPRRLGAGGGGRGQKGQVNQFLRQAQLMQEQMGKVQEEIAQMEAEGKAGDNLVVARVNGANELLSITIDPDAIDPEDKELLEDLIVVAVNDALRTMKAQSDERMAEISGGMGSLMAGLGGGVPKQTP